MVSKPCFEVRGCKPYIGFGSVRRHSVPIYVWDNILSEYYSLLLIILLLIILRYNTNFIVNSPWGLFRDNHNNDKDNQKKYSKIINKQLLKNYLHIKFATLKTDLRGRL